MTSWWPYVLSLVTTAGAVAIGAFWGYALGRAHGLRRARGLAATLATRAGHAATAKLLLDAIDKVR